MIAERPEFPCPVIVIDDFLPKEEADACLEECIKLEPIFMPAALGAGSEHRTDLSMRENEVVYLDTTFGPARDRSKILKYIHKAIGTDEGKTIWHEGDLIFDIINYSTWRESVLSRYGNCNHYGQHQDTVFNKEHPNYITRRIVTLCYYMQREPARYSGGGLTLHKNGEQITLQPRHNRAVVFPSFTSHEVQSVKLEDTQWDSGRFSLNHWMGFQ